MLECGKIDSSYSTQYDSWVRITSPGIDLDEPVYLSGNYIDWISTKQPTLARCIWIPDSDNAWHTWERRVGVRHIPIAMPPLEPNSVAAIWEKTPRASFVVLSLSNPVPTVMTERESLLRERAKLRRSFFARINPLKQKRIKHIEERLDELDARLYELTDTSSECMLSAMRAIQRSQQQIASYLEALESGGNQSS